MYSDLGYLSVYSRRARDWTLVVHIRCNFLDGLSQYCTFSQDGAALILGFNGKLRLWSTEYLIQIPECVSLFREIKYTHTWTSESSLDHSLSCIEVFRALTHLGYSYYEICRIIDTIKFQSERRKQPTNYKTAITSKVQQPTVSMLRRQSTVGYLKPPRSAAFFLSCVLLDRDTDESTTSGRYNPVAFIFNAEEKEIGRTEIAYNTADPVFSCPFLLSSQTERRGQKVTVKVYNANPMISYKVNAYPKIEVNLKFNFEDNNISN